MTRFWMRVRRARFVAFGEAPVIAYLAAKEAEILAIRIILTGRLADLAPDIIRERLREGVCIRSRWWGTGTACWKLQALGLSVFPVETAEEARRVIHATARGRRMRSFT